MGGWRIGQPIGIKPEAKQVPPLGFLRPILVLVARVQHSVIVQDQRLAGNQRMRYQQIGVAGATAK